MTTALQPVTGLRKAAVLMVLLGDESAKKIYKILPDKDVNSLTQEIADLRQVSPVLASTVLEEYYRLSMTQTYVAQGGFEYATKLLVEAFGKERADTLLEQVQRAQEASAGNLETLQKADPQQLAKDRKSVV